jgi:TPR repeat protein
MKILMFMSSAVQIVLCILFIDQSHAQTAVANVNEPESPRQRTAADDASSQEQLCRKLYWDLGGRTTGAVADEAEKGLRLAATGGAAECQYYLGEFLYEKNQRTEAVGDEYVVRRHIAPALEWFEKSAAQGYTSAQGRLAAIYRYDLVPPDVPKAFALTRIVAEKGYAGAQHILGGMYEKGDGTPRNYKQSAYWYLRAASQGHVVAQYDVGRMYYGGIGFPQDKAVAYFWWLMAAGKSPQFAKAVEARDGVERELPSTQILLIQERAASWVAVQEPER